MLQDSNYFLKQKYNYTFQGLEQTEIFLHQVAGAQIEKMRALNQIDSSKLTDNFWAAIVQNTDKIVGEKRSISATKQFIKLVDTSEKYIQAMQNLSNLGAVIANPKTYEKLPQAEREQFYQNLQATFVAAKNVAKPMLSRADLLSPTNLKHLDYLNKTVVALTAHAQDPLNSRKLSTLKATSPNLDKLTVSRNVQILKGCLKVVIANSIRLVAVLVGIVGALDTGLDGGLRLAKKIDEKLGPVSKSGFEDLMNKGSRAEKSAAAPELQNKLKLFGGFAKTTNPPAPDQSNDTGNKFRKK